MELHEIKELIGGGLVRDVARVRQAWIEYGGLLAKCPHKQGRKIGEWVRAEGLDFVENNVDRADAKVLFKITAGGNINFDACPHSYPKNVLKWLRSTGQIPTKQDGRARAKVDEPPQTSCTIGEFDPVESYLVVPLGKFAWHLSALASPNREQFAELIASVANHGGTKFLGLEEAVNPDGSASIRVARINGDAGVVLELTLRLPTAEEAAADMQKREEARVREAASTHLKAMP